MCVFVFVIECVILVTAYDVGPTTCEGTPLLSSMCPCLRGSGAVSFSINNDRVDTGGRPNWNDMKELSGIADMGSFNTNSSVGVWWVSWMKLENGPEF